MCRAFWASRKTLNFTASEVGAMEDCEQRRNMVGLKGQRCSGYCGGSRVWWVRLGARNSRKGDDG